jgi:hypothetical protein
MKMTNKKIFVIAFSIAIIHFALTSVIGHYIAIQIGTQLGQVAAGGIIDSTKQSPQNTEIRATEIYQDMKMKSEDIIKGWRVPLLLISLPAGQVIDHFLQDIRKKRDRMVISKEISVDQYKTQGLMIHYAVNFINSLCFGFLVYIMLRIFSQYKRKT